MQQNLILSLFMLVQAKYIKAKYIKKVILWFIMKAENTPATLGAHSHHPPFLIPITQFLFCLRKQMARDNVSNN